MSNPHKPLPLMKRLADRIKGIGFLTGAGISTERPLGKSQRYMVLTTGTNMKGELRQG